MTNRPEDPISYCEQMLPRVSRTFALNIGVLDGELHLAVLCAYLFCRIVDTVEDTPGLEHRLQIDFLDRYAELFAKASISVDEAAAWSRDWPNCAGSGDELDLLKNLGTVVAAFAGLPHEVRAAICECVVEMARGMKQTIALPIDPLSNLRALKTDADLQQYCYYVAGTVGRMLTKLFCYYTPEIDPQAQSQMLELDQCFARALQVTNIIKDCSGDAGRGWCYIPTELMSVHGTDAVRFFNASSRAQSQAVLDDLIRSTARNLEQALKYTLLIPRSRRRLRLFNLWSLFFAARTLARAAANPLLLDPRQKVKISRFAVYWTMLYTLINAQNDQGLARSLARILGKIDC